MKNFKEFVKTNEASNNRPCLASDISIFGIEKIFKELRLKAHFMGAQGADVPPSNKPLGSCDVYYEVDTYDMTYTLGFRFEEDMLNFLDKFSELNPDCETTIFEDDEDDINPDFPCKVDLQQNEDSEPFNW